MFRFGNSIWGFLCSFMFNVFGFIIKYLPRSQADYDSNTNDSNCSAQQNDQIVSRNSQDSESDGLSEKQNSEFSFGFQFQAFRNPNRSVAETESSFLMERSSTSGTSKYQFLSSKGVSGFTEEPETINFIVQGNFIDLYQPCRGNDEYIVTKVSTQEDIQKIISEAEDIIDQEKTEDSVRSASSGEVLEGAEHEFSTNKEMNILGENFSYGVQFLPENQFLTFDLKPELGYSSDQFLVSTHKVDSGDNIFQLDNHENRGLEYDDANIPIDEIKVEFLEKNWSLKEIGTEDTGFSDSLEVFSREKLEDTDDEFIELEPNFQNSSELIKENLSWKIFGRIEDLHELGSTHSKGTDPLDGLGKSEEQSSEKNSWGSDSDEEDDLDILWEHRDLVEQMKMEVKNARNGGLPTILEECATPKMVGDLKPLKIDETFGHRDRMEEIQKFYKSYSDKMRKLDILNYQTMHAISFLQLKEPVQLIPSKKSSISEIKSILLPNFWPCKLRRIYADQTIKSITELHKDLEVVYVGQVCLSWEILHWLYGKAKELMEYDSRRIHSYNQVGDEFQQFQVLVQRYIEDEAFQGPRIQNYIKKRCILRSLLQVPTIKDDCLKYKKGRIEDEQDEISIAMLAEIVEESMRVFWEFLRADKGGDNLNLKCLQGTRIDLQDPADSELLIDIKTSLQKKEKRLKDILRSGNCIVKKFQKHQGGRMDRSLFLSQVELGLISRVLRLSRLTTDQLVWCQTKLNNITFVDRKIHVEPSFFIFPC